MKSAPINISWMFLSWSKWRSMWFFEHRVKSWHFRRVCPATMMFWHEQCVNSSSYTQAISQFLPCQVHRLRFWINWSYYCWHRRSRFSENFHLMLHRSPSLNTFNASHSLHSHEWGLLTVMVDISSELFVVACLWLSHNPEPHSTVSVGFPWLLLVSSTSNGYLARNLTLSHTSVQCQHIHTVSRSFAGSCRFLD